MAAKAICIITSSVEGKGAYGVRTDTDANVYFPVSIADALELVEYEQVEAIVVNNDRPEPPFKAIKARRLDEETIG